MKNQNEWCNNCQSIDCECVEPRKYVSPFTPDTPTAQWQKEAEDELQQFLSKFSDETIQGMGLAADWILPYIDRLKQKYISEHTAHLAQLQGVIDKSVDYITDYFKEQGIEVSAMVKMRLRSLRTITQTKMKGE